MMPQSTRGGVCSDFPHEEQSVRPKVIRIKTSYRGVPPQFARACTPLHDLRSVRPDPKSTATVRLIPTILSQIIRPPTCQRRRPPRPVSGAPRAPQPVSGARRDIMLQTLFPPPPFPLSFCCCRRRRAGLVHDTKAARRAAMARDLRRLHGEFVVIRHLLVDLEIARRKDDNVPADGAGDVRLGVGLDDDL